MACTAVSSGDSFLGSVLSHIDCQAQTIGSFGYSAVSASSVQYTGLLLGLVTLFIAVFGLRLLLGDNLTLRSTMIAVIKVGAVLTIAVSWPAWRTLAYDTLFKGPGEMSALIANASGLPYGPVSLDRRLQNLDDGLVTLTIAGTGRLTGGIAGSSDIGDSPSGVALADQSGFGIGRVAFLVSVIGPTWIVRLSGGILLALAPLMAGLLLFAATRGLFIGYLRALGFCALGSLGLALVYSVQAAVYEPWLRGVLEQREANVLTPAAPTELLVLSLASLLLAAGWLTLAGKLLFFSEALQWQLPGERPATALQPQSPFHPKESVTVSAGENRSRVQTIARAVGGNMMRDRLAAGDGAPAQYFSGDLGRPMNNVAQEQPLRARSPAASARRTNRRISAATGRRDAKP